MHSPPEEPPASLAAVESLVSILLLNPEDQTFPFCALIPSDRSFIYFYSDKSFDAP